MRRSGSTSPPTWESSAAGRSNAYRDRISLGERRSTSMPISRRARRSRQRTNSIASQQWLQHLHQPRSARIHPHLLCMVPCTTTTNHTLLADRSALQHKATLTDLQTQTAIPRRTCNARPHHQQQERELASFPRTSRHHPRRQLHPDLQYFTRHPARPQLVEHLQTCSATQTTPLAATSQHRNPSFLLLASP